MDSNTPVPPHSPHKTLPVGTDGSRRDFLRQAAAGACALVIGNQVHAAAPSVPAPRTRGRTAMGLVTPRLDVVRWGIIGVGERGRQTLRETLLLEHCEVRAVCDNHEPTLRAAVEMVVTMGKPMPAVYGDGEEAYRKLLERDDIDAVYICTPWHLHATMGVEALRAGKHAFIEVPMAMTVDECWQLVEAAERAQLHCMMLENVCYGREELMVLRMCRENLFGELLHGEAAYIHDLRHQMKHLEHGTGSWRLREHERRDGNLYPTHGLGPVAQYMNINRGDRFERLVSFSSQSLGAPDYAERNFPAGHPRRTARYRCGDMNTSLIRTARGRTIVLQHNTMNPRPYSRLNLIQGTRGVFSGYPNRIYVEGRSAREHQWDTDLARWYAEFEHPLWTKVAEIATRLGKEGAAGLGHGGMDFVMRWRLVQCLLEGLPMDQDVYDGAAWSVVGPLSDESVSRDGAPVKIPDFTRGGWQTASPLGIVS